jgi:cytoskeletal protein CcmA (bactofilin family)
MVFGSKRETKPDSLSREDVVGNLYPDSLTSEVDVAQAPSEFPRTSDRGNESVIDPHARFNGKYVSDRDLRIEGEAQGEIECQGTLIISPQARVRSAIKAHNVIVNGDYEGDVDCGGRFEIGSTGRVKGNIKTQVLVVKEGAHWEGGVTMTREPGARPATPPQQAQAGAGGQGGQRPAQGGGGQGGQGGQGGGSIFSKGEREGSQREGSQREGQPAGQGGGGQ